VELKKAVWLPFINTRVAWGRAARTYTPPTRGRSDSSSEHEL